MQHAGPAAIMGGREQLISGRIPVCVATIGCSAPALHYVN